VVKSDSSSTKFWTRLHSPHLAFHGCGLAAVHRRTCNRAGQEQLAYLYTHSGLDELSGTARSSRVLGELREWWPWSLW
jgi:hypothetical protein